MKYYTADGHEIVRDGVYKDSDGDKFVCLGFKSQGQNLPIVGVARRERGEEVSMGYNPGNLTLWHEPAAPETVEVWEVVYRMGNLVYANHYTSQSAAIENSKKRDVLTIRLKETITVGGDDE